MNLLEKIEESANAVEKELIWIREKISQLDHNKHLILIGQKIGTILEQHHKLQQQLKRETKEFSKITNELSRLRKENDTVSSNNYLLEYKKKDLLVLADELEEANEKIKEQNKAIKEQTDEVEIQKEALEDQADYLHEATERMSAMHLELQKQKEEILEKNQELTNLNDELETQKESIQDQADYLHDANERISAMHVEVQKQKDEILEKNDELIKLNNEKNNLISIVAHDLKSPLNQISGLISLIKITGPDLEGDQKKFMNAMNESVNRLNTMVAKILDVKAIEAKKLNIQYQKVNLVRILSELYDIYNHTATEKRLHLTNEIELAEAYAWVDSGYTTQVYENLISNALKFSPGNKNIYLRLTKVDQQWRFEVKDEGPGISEDDQKKLFGKFQKLTARPTANETSTGLGLSIVKKYTEAMAGKIWCESQPNAGASFFVDFPVKE